MWQRLVVDIRGEFRPSFSNDLFVENTDDSFLLYRWGASARVGYEF